MNEERDMEDDNGGISIYVFPTEDGMPARAMLSKQPKVVNLEEEGAPEPPEGVEVVAIEVQQAVAVWTADAGCWTVEGNPLPPGLSDAISAHAASLGVPGF
jgi:hypothetical protein